MATPLYSTLKQCSDEKPLRLHMPGHKGKTHLFPADFLSLDFTELSTTGNLYEGGVPFDEAQFLWAEKFGFPHGQFLTGGSTQGVYTALALCGKQNGDKQGEKLLIDRGAHRSVFHGMGLLQLKPVYLQRPWIKGLEVPGPVDPWEVDFLLEENPDIKTVVITSPTYHGILSDVSGIAKVVHGRGAKLVVDGAHGSHFPWVGIDHFSSADVVTISPHKTLPALGQAAILLYRNFSPNIVAETAVLFGTSSPSYPIMASMDLVRHWMEGEGEKEYRRVASQVGILRQLFPSLQLPLSLDPTRLTILCQDGQRVAKQLEKKGIYLEMANKGHLVAIFSGMDSNQEVLRFAKTVFPYIKNRGTIADLSPPQSLPLKRMDIHEVLYSNKITLSLKESVGKIAASTIAPYPPGVPVVSMGEEISQREVEYLQHIGYEENDVFVIE